MKWQNFASDPEDVASAHLVRVLPLHTYRDKIRHHRATSHVNQNMCQPPLLLKVFLEIHALHQARTIHHIVQYQTKHILSSGRNSLLIFTHPYKTDMPLSSNFSRTCLWKRSISDWGVDTSPRNSFRALKLPSPPADGMRRDLAAGLKMSTRAPLRKGGSRRAGA